MAGSGGFRVLLEASRIAFLCWTATHMQTNTLGLIHYKIPSRMQDFCLFAAYHNSILYICGRQNYDKFCVNKKYLVPLHHHIAFGSPARINSGQGLRWERSVILRHYPML